MLDERRCYQGCYQKTTYRNLTPLDVSVEEKPMEGIEPNNIENAFEYEAVYSPSVTLQIIWRKTVHVIWRKSTSTAATR